MVLPSLSEIRRLRRRLGLTQSELARRAGVSQSLVAKVEGGRLHPSYLIALKLFSVLEEVGGESERTAGEVMNKKVVCVSCSDNLRVAVEKMRANEFSQLPVMDGERVVGMVSEASVLDAFWRGSNAKTVREVMEEAPPIVSLGTSTRVVALMLKHCPLVLVADEGRVSGVITRADLLYAQALE